MVAHRDGLYQALHPLLYHMRLSVFSFLGVVIKKTRRAEAAGLYIEYLPRKWTGTHFLEFGDGRPNV